MAVKLKLVLPEAEAEPPLLTSPPMGEEEGELGETPKRRRPILPEDAPYRPNLHSPRGAERGGHPIRDYYNPRPGVLAKKRRIRKAGAALFARYGVAAIGLDRVADAAGLNPTGARAYYHGRNELLVEIVAEHLDSLAAALAAAHDGHAASVPEVLLEALIRAWLDTIAAEPDAHRTMLMCAHLLPERRREANALRRLVLLESILEPLSISVPGLSASGEAAAPLLRFLETLLSPHSAWPTPSEPESRRRDARRITGMLLAAAEAEAAGFWPRLGDTAGAAPEGAGTRLVLETQQARARFREALDAARSGAEVVITRRGRATARLVGVR